jgi:hypothetical protein
MARNVTLKLDEALLRKARQVAVAADKSLSQWVADLIAEALSSNAGYARGKQEALRRLEQGFKLGGVPLSREEAHDRA